MQPSSWWFLCLSRHCLAPELQPGPLTAVISDPIGCPGDSFWLKPWKIPALFVFRRSRVPLKTGEGFRQSRQLVTNNKHDEIHYSPKKILCIYYFKFTLCLVLAGEWLLLLVHRQKIQAQSTRAPLLLWICEDWMTCMEGGSCSVMLIGFPAISAIIYVTLQGGSWWPWCRGDLVPLLQGPVIFLGLNNCLCGCE